MNTIYQTFIDQAVANGVVPGIQAMVFDKDGLIFEGVSGLSSVASSPSGEVHMRKDTGLALFACSKLVISLVALRILERGLSKAPFRLSDLDDHEKLVSVLPEFKLKGGHMVTKILEGYNQAGPDGKKEMKLRDARKGCTLRHLFTHTSGLCYFWNEASHTEMFLPSEGKPNFPLVGKAVQDFNYPLVCEAGERYIYGVGAEWLGQWIVRSTVKNLRRLCKDLVFEPLELDASEIDLVPLINNSDIHVRGSGESQFVKVPFELPVPADGWNPEQGGTWLGSGPVISTLQAYSKVLRAVLRKDITLLDPETWCVALSDQTTPMGAAIDLPLWKSRCPGLVHDMDEYSAQSKPGDFGINLLQAQVFNSSTKSGLPRSSQAWGGATNVYWFLDPVNEIGSLIGGQLFPFFDPQTVKMRDAWEKLVSSQISHHKQ